jgi:hypothetical protein
MLFNGYFPNIIIIFFEVYTDLLFMNILSLIITVFLFMLALFQYINDAPIKTLMLKLKKTSYYYQAYIENYKSKLQYTSRNSH